MDEPRLGQIIEGPARRDAIHIAVFPATACERLSPGEHVGFPNPGDPEKVGKCEKPLGVVDPFLARDVEAGERFWLFLYPKSVTGLRHAWEHPAFPSSDERGGIPESADLGSARYDAARKWLLDLCEGREEDESADSACLVGVRTLIRLGAAALHSHRLRRADHEFHSIPDEAWDSSLVLETGSDFDLCYRLHPNRVEFWRNMSIVTGIPLPDERAVARSTFGCEC